MTAAGAIRNVPTVTGPGPIRPEKETTTVGITVASAASTTGSSKSAAEQASGAPIRARYASPPGPDVAYAIPQQIVGPTATGKIQSRGEGFRRTYTQSAPERTSATMTPNGRGSCRPAPRTRSDPTSPGLTTA